uniref:Uncharacterized protein n=1 Tax=Arion vulgaris TaxID=1028688 RepID=A0A0B7B4Q1_9EUPU
MSDPRIFNTAANIHEIVNKDLHLIMLTLFNLNLLGDTGILSEHDFRINCILANNAPNL